MQCDIKLDVDCTDYQLYFFPDELDAVIFDKIHGRRDMDLSEEGQRYPEKARNAFCVYLDGWVKLHICLKNDIPLPLPMMAGKLMSTTQSGRSTPTRPRYTASISAASCC